MKTLITGWGKDPQKKCYYYTTPGTKVYLPFAKTVTELLNHLNTFEHKFIKL